MPSEPLLTSLREYAERVLDLSPRGLEDRLRVGRAPRDGATRAVPPRVRRQVLARHQGRCAVPGCRNAILHVHHVVARVDGGTHDPDNLCPLCSAHHRAAHDGALVIEGAARDGLSFRHADGRAHGTATAELASRRVLAEAFEALVGMGWKEREARALQA